jgi:DNA-binding transcriptional regulator YiaG
VDREPDAPWQQWPEKPQAVGTRDQVQDQEEESNGEKGPSVLNEAPLFFRVFARPLLCSRPAVTHSAISTYRAGGILLPPTIIPVGQAGIDRCAPAGLRSRMAGILIHVRTFVTRKEFTMATSTRRASSLQSTSTSTSLSVADIRAKLGISRERMGRLLDVSARTIQRWEDNAQLPSNRWVTNVLVQTNEIVDLGLEVFTPESVTIIMTTPQPGFDGVSGLDMIEQGRGNEVLGLFALTYEGGLGI